MEEVERRRIRAGRHVGVGVGERHVVEARPLQHHEARPHVDLLHQAVGHGAVGGAAHRGQVAADRVVGGDQRRALARELELVQVGLDAVSGVHVAHIRVGLVEQHVFAEPVPVHRDVSLPPRQHGLAQVFLHAEVGRERVRGQRLEPDQSAVRFEDHRPRLAGTGVRRHEQVARGDARRLHGDGDRRRVQVRARGERSALRRGRPRRSSPACA